MEKTIRYMQDNINTMIRLDELSGYARLSTSHYSAIFRAKTGYSPIEYFNQLKVQKACQYISFTTMSIKNIALSLGIEDQYYFTRMFTKLMGISHYEYRKKVKASPGNIEEKVASVKVKERINIYLKFKYQAIAPISYFLPMTGILSV